MIAWRMNHARIESAWTTHDLIQIAHVCKCKRCISQYMIAWDRAHALTAFGLDRQGPLFWRFRTVYLPCHTRIAQFLGNICFSSVYEITDLCVHCRLTMLVHLSLFTCIFFYTVHCRFVCLIDYSLVCACGIGESAGLSGIWEWGFGIWESWGFGYMRMGVWVYENGGLVDENGGLGIWKWEFGYMGEMYCWERVVTELRRNSFPCFIWKQWTFLFPNA
jgi:hypothetical protein